MINLGLVSVTFRQLSCEEIIEIVSSSGLSAIEWGGDVHVPHGDVARAKEVRRLMENHGLVTASYGSYYRAGEKENPSFESVVDTALALGTSNIRIWAGKRGSFECLQNISKEGAKTFGGEYWNNVVSDCRRIASLAAASGLNVSFEFHCDTLTDHTGAALQLLSDIHCPNMLTYWQPPHHLSFDERVSSLNQMLPYTTNVHVFHWNRLDDGKNDMRPLCEGEMFWSKYFEILREGGREHFALMEFVKDSSVENFLADVEVFKRL